MPYKPGESGNPGGRPHHGKDLAAYIGRKTNKGRRLVDELVAILDAPTAKTEHKLAAIHELADRYWGKAVSTTILDAQISVSDDSQLEQLTLQDVLAIRDKLRHDAWLAAHPIVDAPAAPVIQGYRYPVGGLPPPES